MPDGSKRSVKGVPAKKSGPTLSNERYIQICHAMDSLSTGLEIMRLISCSFDTDGRPYFASNVVNLHASLGVAIDHIKKASELLFEFSSKDADARESQAFIDVLWDSADVVICVQATLQHEKLPHGYGMTVCPARGALMVAISKFEGLVSDISAFLAKAAVLPASRARGVAVAEVAHA